MIDIDKITLFLNLNLMYYFDICFKKKKKNSQILRDFILT